tara:strand:- start:7556 stop:9658 length:2103 start_codon:yes stop_codon:yes gene_type:complete
MSRFSDTEEDSIEGGPWATHGVVDEDNEQVAASRLIASGNKTVDEIYYPILGVIDAVYYADDPSNESNSSKNHKDSNVSFNEILANTEETYYQKSVAVTRTKGARIEARVKIVSGPQGRRNSGQFIEKVPVCIGFGGVHNYGYVVPTATTNTGVLGYRGTEDGDYCLVQFIGGSWLNPVITSIWPNPLNTQDPPSVADGGSAYARISGTEILIDSEGDLLLDARGANERVISDSESGNYVRKPASGNDGAITVVTRNNIYVAAGYPNENESAGSLPEGTAVLQASKDVEMFSTLQSVKIYSKRESKDDDGKLTRVDIQGPRGSLRPAARKYDRVKITSGDSGDLFEYIKQMSVAINSAGKLLTKSIDPGAAAAGEILSNFVSNNPVPTYQTGQITTGSDYCYIAGKGNASDVGFDENGIKDQLGESISPETLEDFKNSCTAEAASDTVTGLTSEESSAAMLSGVSGGLKTAEKALELVPGGQPFAIIIGEALPKVLGLVTQTLLSSPDSEMKDVNLPSGANMEDVVGEDGTGGASGEVATLSSEVDTLKSIEEDIKTSWEVYRLNPTEENANAIPVNPNRENNPTIVGNQPDPSLDPPGPPVKNSGYWYTNDDLTDPLSLYYDGDAISSRQEQMKSLGDEIGDLIEGIPFLSPTEQKSIELSTALAEGAASEDYSEVNNLTGGSIEQSANSCIDKKISEA